MEDEKLISVVNLAWQKAQLQATPTSRQSFAADALKAKWNKERLRSVFGALVPSATRKRLAPAVREAWLNQQCQDIDTALQALRLSRQAILCQSQKIPFSGGRGDKSSNVQSKWRAACGTSKRLKGAV